MKFDGNNVTRQSNNPKEARVAGSWWVVPVVALLAFPAPSWSQFKEPVRTELTSGGRGNDWSAHFSGDMLDVVWVSRAANTTVSR